MTTSAQAVAAVDELAAQLQAYVEDGRFLPRFFDRLFGLRTALGSARERFSAEHAEADDELPLFATVLDRATAAILAGEDLAPTAGGVARYGRAVEYVVEALSPASVTPLKSLRRRQRATISPP